MTEEQKRKKRERERQRQNGTPIIAQNLVEKVTPQIIFLDTTALFLRMSYFKCILCSGMKIEFLFLTGIK